MFAIDCIGGGGEEGGGEGGGGASGGCVSVWGLQLMTQLPVAGAVTSDTDGKRVEAGPQRNRNGTATDPQRVGGGSTSRCNPPAIGQWIINGHWT